jgi:hypothetical protein
LDIRKHRTEDITRHSGGYKGDSKGSVRVLLSQKGIQWAGLGFKLLYHLLNHPTTWVYPVWHVRLCYSVGAGFLGSVGVYGNGGIFGLITKMNGLSVYDITYNTKV